MRFFDVRGIVLGLVIVAAILGVLGAKSLYNQWWPSYKFRSALAGVSACAGEKDGVACVRPEIKKLLELTGGADLMDILSARSGPMWCHYVGHVVGQQMYTRYHDVEAAISQCNRACDSACIHGIIGGAFAEELGIDYEKLNLAHMSVDELRKVGKRLCTNIGTCHGVGHALFQVYQKFEPAFAVCREVSGSMLNQCYNGVTMEYADILSSRSMTSPPDIEYPDKDSLRSLCDFPSLPEMRACFRYFPRMVYATLRRQDVSEAQSLEIVKNVCESYGEAMARTACFSGMGSSGSYLVLTNTPAAVKSCQGLGSRQAEASCIIGKLAVATEDRTKPLALYCAAMSDVPMRTICYQGLFFFLNRIGTSMERMREICGSDDGVCQQGLRNLGIDPMEQIRSFSRTS